MRIYRVTIIGTRDLHADNIEWDDEIWRANKDNKKNSKPDRSLSWRWLGRLVYHDE